VILATPEGAEAQRSGVFDAVLLKWWHWVPMAFILIDRRVEHAPYAIQVETVTLRGVHFRK
jgi:hypothetical protein